MRRIAVSLALALAAAPAAAACADGAGSGGAGSEPSYFPLQQGNRWTYEGPRGDPPTTVTAARVRAGVFRLNGFPGAATLRLRWSGGVLQVRDAGQRRWEAFLRLGAAKGTSWQINLPDPVWTQARATVESRTATVRVGPLGRSFARSVRIVLRPSPELSDAGITKLVFAPGVGLVLWEELTFGGSVTYALSSARVNGRTLGGR